MMRTSFVEKHLCENGGIIVLYVNAWQFVINWRLQNTVVLISYKFLFSAFCTLVERKHGLSCFNQLHFGHARAKSQTT